MSRDIVVGSAAAATLVAAGGVVIDFSSRFRLSDPSYFRPLGGPRRYAQFI